MKKGSIVMAVSGNVGIVSILNVDGCIHDGIVGFRNLNTNIILPEYLLFVLGLLKRTYETKQDGAIFQNLTTTIVKEIEVPVPSISEQKRWRSFFVNTLELEERLLTSRRKMDELFYSLQHSAFSGQL
jgi:restriction endonuclease S subunit